MEWKRYDENGNIIYELINDKGIRMTNYYSKVNI